MEGVHEWACVHLFAVTTGHFMITHSGKNPGTLPLLSGCGLDTL